MTYKAIILKIRKGDKRAQRYLFDMSCGLLQSVAYRYCKSNIETADILQESYIKIFSNLPKFVYKDERTTMAWMKRIVANESIRHIKKSSRFKSSEPLPQMTAIYSSHHLEYDDLYKTVLSLPLKQRIVFNMHALEGYSHEEIGKHLGIETSSSRSLLSRARRTLQSIVIKESTYGNV